MTTYPPDVWTQALLVTPPRMCGRRLRPYSNAHEVVLRALGNPILHGESVTHAQLVQAVWVTQRTLGECRQLFANTWQVYLRLSVFAWRWRHLPLSLSVRQWRQYRDDFIRSPEHWEYKDDGDKRRAAAPIEWHLVRNLGIEWPDVCRQYGSAWDVPRGMSICCWDVTAERAGDSTLMNRFDTLVRYADEQKRKAAADGDEESAQEWSREIGALCAAYRHLGN